MALQLNLGATQFGIAAPEAYAKIENFMGDKNSLQVMVRMYYNKTARDANNTPIMQNNHNINVAQLTGDLVSGIYNILKTLPEYIGSVDV